MSKIIEKSINFALTEQQNVELTDTHLPQEWNDFVEGKIAEFLQIEIGSNIYVNHNDWTACNIQILIIENLENVSNFAENITCNDVAYVHNIVYSINTRNVVLLNIRLRWQKCLFFLWIQKKFLQFLINRILFISLFTSLNTRILNKRWNDIKYYCLL